VDLGLAGQVAIVTGASKGIGLAVTQALVDERVAVVAGARHASPELMRLARTGRVDFVAADLATPDGPAHLIDAAAGRGRLDILVNNVGAVTPRPGGFLSVTDDDWVTAFMLNVMAAVRTTRAALPMMLAAGGGSVVTVSSVNAFLPDPLVMDYGAAKAALANFSKALSKEVGSQGIRMNTVSPGPVATDLWLGPGGVADTLAAENGADPAAVAAGAAAASVSGRFTQPEEIGRLVAFLASAVAGNVTGTDVTIDGGLVTTT
jgi:NAD(P)-dependent dehydrogenase (short-subunit alcohol dehydrogenase family)